MNFPPSSIVLLARLLRRDGFAFFGKCARFAFSRDAWLWLLRGGRSSSGPARFSRRDIETIRRSPWFDEAWICREHPEILRSGVSPAEFYLVHGTTGAVGPGPDFVGDEYLALNPDVQLAGMNPLLHFEQYGSLRCRQISFLEDSKTVFPDGATEQSRDFAVAPPKTFRTAVFAAFSGNGRISAANLLYLRGLSEIADNVVYVSNNPVFPDEVRKLDGLVCHATFANHGEYDFGSYKRGFRKAVELGLLAPERTRELILANDSCIGPVVPFSKAFSAMETRRCDFWGLTAYLGFGQEHVQSYFMVFRRKVLDGRELRSFLDGVKRESDRWRVISHYEVRLTPVLREAGYRGDTLVPWNFFRDEADDHGRLAFPPASPVTLLRRYGMPLVKTKTINGENDESPDELLGLIGQINPELRKLVHPRPKAAPGKDVAAHPVPREKRLSHMEACRENVRRIAEKAASGEAVRTVFLVSDPAMFPARPLFEAMRRGAKAFSPSVCVVPDLRWTDPEERMARCFDELQKTIPAGFLRLPHSDRDGCWTDVLSGADIVCYPSPYDLSNFLFNPHWAVGRSFLPIHVNYGFYRSVYDRGVMSRQNYAYFWKAFFECEATAKEYAEHSILQGANAEVVGYVKMDALFGAKPWPRNGNRKRVMIAPHHSVEGGANDTLALSNFERYADYFLELPRKHPELDFVFRPHPFLFTVLARPGKWGRAKAERWIARMKAHPNVRWSDEGDYFPAFASCDAIVQDCGSYLVEWFYTGKPCCYMLKDPGDIDAKFSPLGMECLSHCYLAYGKPAIESFLRDVVEGGNDPKSAARDEFRKSVMVNYPHAADAALASIKRALGAG